MKKRKIITTVFVILLIICLIPFPISYKDGGTVKYSAVLYKVIVWHTMNPGYDYNKVDSNGKYIGTEPFYLTGTDVYIFPFNFGDKGYWDRARSSK